MTTPGLGHNAPPTPVQELTLKLKEDNVALVRQRFDLDTRFEALPATLVAQADHDRAAQLGKDIVGFEKSIAAHKELVKRPYKELVDTVDGFFGNLARPLTPTKDTLRVRITAFLNEKRAAEQRARDLAAAEARRIANEAAEAARAKAADFDDLPTEQALIPAVAAEDKAKSAEAHAQRAEARAAAPAADLSRQHTPSGVTTSLRKVLVLTVVDKQKVPPEFIFLDEAGIKKAWRNGRRDIPGVTITEETEAGWR